VFVRDEQGAMQDGGQIDLALPAGEKVGQEDYLAFLCIESEKDGQVCALRGFLNGFLSRVIPLER
jgi:hypothetical protein